jgi:Predicted membrane protein
MTENYCSNCSEALKEFAVVCNGCGKPVSGPNKSEQTNAKKQTKELADYCSNCGEALKEFAVVCNGCGKPVTGSNKSEQTNVKKQTNKLPTVFVIIFVIILVIILVIFGLSII